MGGAAASERRECIPNPPPPCPPHPHPPPPKRPMEGVGLTRGPDGRLAGALDAGPAGEEAQALV